MLDSISTSHPGGAGQVVGTYSYTWDNNRNKTAESISGVMSGYGFSSSTFDNDDRLTAWSRTDGNQDQSWNLSATGNWISFTEEGITENRTHGDAHEVTQVGSAAIGYDNRGNVTSDAARGQSYQWDLDGRLSGVDTDASGTVDVTLQYDALGRRVRKGNWIYAYAGDQVVAEYSSPSQSVSTPSIRFVYGAYVDEPIVKYNSSDLPFWYHRNHQYSIVAMSNSGGSVSERYGYDPHGRMTILAGNGTTVRSVPAYSSRFTYTGRRWDEDLNVYDFRARMYDAQLGRFLSRDPLGYVDGMNVYRGYFAVQGLDPWGLDILVPTHPFGAQSTSTIVFDDGFPSGFLTGYSPPLPEDFEFPVIGLFSGVNSGSKTSTNDDSPEGNYLIKLWEQYFRTFPYDTEFSNNSLFATFGTGNRQTVLNPNVGQAMNEEACQIAEQYYSQGQLCGPKKTRVKVFMLMPKTRTPFEVNDCCDMDVSVIWSPHDMVPNNTPFKLRDWEDLEYWRRWANDIVMIDNHGFAVGDIDHSASHVFGEKSNLIEPRSRSYGLPFAYPKPIINLSNGTAQLGFGQGFWTWWTWSGWAATGAKYDFRSDVRSAVYSGKYDNVLICHSQGCNILVSILNRVCSAK